MVTTALPLNEAIVTQIQKILETEFKAKVELSQKVDNRLLGGFVIRVEDKQYDSSLSTQLKKIREQLLHTELK